MYDYVRVYYISAINGKKRYKKKIKRLPSNIALLESRE
jgi:hypothetical protein